jgi:hypothetical protein
LVFNSLGFYSLGCIFKYHFLSISRHWVHPTREEFSFSNIWAKLASVILNSIPLALCPTNMCHNISSNVDSILQYNTILISIHEHLVTYGITNLMCITHLLVWHLSKIVGIFFSWKIDIKLHVLNLCYQNNCIHEDFFDWFIYSWLQKVHLVIGRLISLVR